MNKATIAAGVTMFLALVTAAPAAADFLTNDDLIVNGGSGSACVGFDCIDGENFGFDTIRMKENNTRLNFTDTSDPASFPADDWTLTANDSESSANGGLDKFSIDDVTTAKTPFTIEGGARTNALYVDSSNRVGFGTNNPILDLHTVSSNTPGLRLEQTNGSGFDAQTWDVAGNEANFFIRDITGGSHLSFRIRPGAPTSSIDIAASGNVGIGNASPTAALHVKRGNGTAQVKVEEASGTRASRTLLSLMNNGAVVSKYVDTGAVTWDVGTDGTSFVLNTGGNPKDFVLRQNGDLQIGGTLTQLSDRRAKTNVKPVDSNAVLAKLTGLPLSTWSYKDDRTTTHLGPMAQDFSAVFGLGSDRRHIAPGDMAGVAMAAIQALGEQNRALGEQNRTLKAELRALEARVATLEK